MISCHWYRWCWSARRDAGQHVGAMAARHFERCAECRDWTAAVEQMEHAMAPVKGMGAISRDEAERIWLMVAAARTRWRESSLSTSRPSRLAWGWIVTGAVAAVALLFVGREPLQDQHAEPELSNLGFAAAGELAEWASRLGEWSLQPTVELNRMLSAAVQPLLDDVRQVISSLPTPPRTEML